MPHSVCLRVGATSGHRNLLGASNCLQAQDNAQQIPGAVVSDSAPDPVHPATMAWPDIPSHGAKMYSVIYIAAGEEPHPTILMLHGFLGTKRTWILHIPSGVQDGTS